MRDPHLNEKEWLEFMNNLFHPKKETIEMRDAFFKKIDETLEVSKLDDGTVVLTSPDITLSEKDVEGL